MSYRVKSRDITSAFLQSVPKDRDVERRIPGLIWKLKKNVYGLVNASHAFYLNLSGDLVNSGCLKSKLDPAMFIYFEENNDDICKEPSGIAITHVDDIMSA